jgi:hypothetical protein
MQTKRAMTDWVMARFQFDALLLVRATWMIPVT